MLSKKKNKSYTVTGITGDGFWWRKWIVTVHILFTIIINIAIHVTHELLVSKVQGSMQRVVHDGYCLEGEKLNNHHLLHNIQIDDDSTLSALMLTYELQNSNEAFHIVWNRIPQCLTRKVAFRAIGGMLSLHATQSIHQKVRGFIDWQERVITLSQAMHVWYRHWEWVSAEDICQSRGW